MDDSRFAEFMQFSRQYRHKFRQIANATRNECEHGDVQNEAWILVERWEQAGTPIDFDNPQDIDKLFSFLYNKLVNHVEKKIRNAVRLDHYSSGDNSENGVHPLMNKLGAPEGSQPLQLLLASESAADQARVPEPHESRAGAYLYLLQHHRNKMQSVADELLISLSYCYYRFNEALEMARSQCDLPDTIGKLSPAFSPGPWRSFRLPRRGRPPCLTQHEAQMELSLPFLVDSRS